MISWSSPLLFKNEHKFVTQALKSSWISDGKYIVKILIKSIIAFLLSVFIN